MFNDRKDDENKDVNCDGTNLIRQDASKCNSIYEKKKCLIPSVCYFSAHLTTVNGF